MNGSTKQAVLVNWTHPEDGGVTSVGLLEENTQEFITIVQSDFWGTSYVDKSLGIDWDTVTSVFNLAVGTRITRPGSGS
jgi:hypothetical protein